jgi:hypothetical protein
MRTVEFGETAQASSMSTQPRMISGTEAVGDGNPLLIFSQPAGEDIVTEGELRTASRSEPSTCCALACLLNELLSFYVSAEKIHWYLRLHPDDSHGTRTLPERFARDICENTLNSISLIMRLQYIFDRTSGQERAALMTVVAAKQSELNALATGPEVSRLEQVRP